MIPVTRAAVLKFISTCKYKKATTIVDNGFSSTTYGSEENINAVITNLSGFYEKDSDGIKQTYDCRIHTLEKAPVLSVNDHIKQEKDRLGNDLDQWYIIKSQEYRPFAGYRAYLGKKL